MSTLRFDTGDIQRLKNQIERGIGVKALNKALGTGVYKTAKQGQTQVRRGIIERYNIKSSDVAPSLSITRAGDTATIIARHLKKTRIPLFKFGAKSSAKGVTFRVVKTGPRQRIGHAFIATMGNGYKGVFERKDRTKGRAIREKVGIDVVQMMSEAGVMTKTIAKIEEVGARVIEHELKYALRKAGFK